MKFYLDEDLSPKIAEILRRNGIGVYRWLRRFDPKDLTSLKEESSVFASEFLKTKRCRCSIIIVEKE